MIEGLNYILNLIDKCDHIELDGSVGKCLDIPAFEVMPSDFLKYAEDELGLKTTKSKVNAVSNLKRALDCQIDIFLESLYFKNIFDKYNLKFEQKTKFLANIGLLSIKSINKLNLIRNKMEHKYSIPSIEDLQLYYDLAWYVTEIIQAKLLSISANVEINYMIYYNNKKYYCDIIYEYKNCGFKIKISDYTKTENKDEQVDIEIYLRNKNDEDSFIKVFKFYLYTLEFNGFINLCKYKNAVRELMIELEDNLR